MTTTPSRRTVIGAAAGGAVVAAAGAATTRRAGFRRPAAAVAATPGVLDLYINEGFVPMVDGSLVYMRGYGDTAHRRRRPEAEPDHLPAALPRRRPSAGQPALPADAEAAARGPARAGRAWIEADAGHYRVSRARWASFFPRRTIIAETGSTVRLRVHNRLAGNHVLDIPGLGGPAGVSTGQIAPGRRRS